MNICIVTEYFPHSDCLDIKGGVEVCCYNEALELSKYHNVTVIDGMQMVPHFPEYFLDNLHPNALGCEIYGRNLAEAILAATGKKA